MGRLTESMGRLTESMRYLICTGGAPEQTQPKPNGPKCQPNGHAGALVERARLRLNAGHYEGRRRPVEKVEE